MQARRSQDILLVAAEVDGTITDVLVRAGVIAAIGNVGDAPADCSVINADGRALLPGLHDHHIHLRATATAFRSIGCGPPHATSPEELARRLHDAPGNGWIRGIGYHPSGPGQIDRAWLDCNGPARPVRIQHRSGRLWILNSMALAELGLSAQGDGQLFDSDAILAAARLPGPVPDLQDVGRRLAARGVIGLTDATARNDLAEFMAISNSGLPQKLLVMGSEEVGWATTSKKAQPGPLKLHYHDHDLPEIGQLAARIALAHGLDRPVASHCTTLGELLVTLAALDDAGVHAGDRIEHGSIIPPDVQDRIADMGLTVVTQPHFLTERAEAYRRDVEPQDHPWLYRVGGLMRCGIAVAGGTDAPFGHADPWLSMAAAVNRPENFGEGEALSPEAALSLYTGHAGVPATQRVVRKGEPADLCLLDRAWSRARRNLATVGVDLTLIDGEVVHCRQGIPKE